MGVFLGHIKTGEPVNGWHLFSIKGYYNSSDNILTGQIEFDWTSCNAGSQVNLLRTDGLGLTESGNNSKNIVIYPNPGNGKLRIDLKEPKSKIQLEIFNVGGQKIFESSTALPLLTNEIDFPSKTKGVYFIKIKDGENIYIEKIIMQ
ncbi:MAG TPA: T9SS type A sorting domain-containing protein [Flavobacterium sp.]|nr:T9SS type A sorting domain-containing protein [Flavobacterium sp.]